MKLVRYGEIGGERPGLIDPDGRLRALDGHIGDITADSLDGAVLERLRRLDPASLPAVEGSPRLGVPIAGPNKIVCIGLNYRDHAAEAGLETPAQPIVFFKPTSSLAGPDDPIPMLRDSRHMDWEVELGVVIGRSARNVAEADALGHVAGYCVVNDVSERAFQALGTGQWVLGKSGDGFCPVGPWLVTADEIADPQALGLWLRVNDRSMQDGTTADMIFGVAALIAFVSRFMSLRPGDLVSTGTPAGVGAGRSPQVFLRAGDRLRLGIAGLGEQTSEVIAAP